MSRKMSEEELMKWERKFKLFGVLHPNFPYYTRSEKDSGWVVCGYCKRKNAGCPDKHLVVDEKGKFTEYPDTVVIAEGQRRWCAEWIKHV